MSEQQMHPLDIGKIPSFSIDRPLLINGGMAETVFDFGGFLSDYCQLISY
ncbi:MAG: hypothetical protein U5K79_05305 [Cyclobacteriaceae bacterium]|nr:hypothetical protein [Cyclobacteriaceae bacterium]